MLELLLIFPSISPPITPVYIRVWPAIYQDISGLSWSAVGFWITRDLSGELLKYSFCTLVEDGDSQGRLHWLALRLQQTYHNLCSPPPASGLEVFRALIYSGFASVLVTPIAPSEIFCCVDHVPETTPFELHRFPDHELLRPLQLLSRRMVGLNYCLLRSFALPLINSVILLEHTGYQLRNLRSLLFCRYMIGSPGILKPHYI